MYQKKMFRNYGTFWPCLFGSSKFVPTGISCEDILDNSKIVSLLETVIGGIYDCEPTQIMKQR